MFSWMQWTLPSAIGFGFILFVIAVVNIIDVYRPGYPRKGFMPMPTTRGDRVFLTLIGSILIFLIWMAIWPEAAVAPAFFVVVPYAVVMMTWG